MDWQSPAIPPTVRRPWQVFEEDLEEKLTDAESQSEFAATLREQLRTVQVRGPLAAFLDLPELQQRQYAEIAVMELSAYVNWRSKQEGPNLDSATEFEAAWDILDSDDKANWLPEDPKTFLEADPMWAPLLVDGPPPCGARGAVPLRPGSPVLVKTEGAAASPPASPLAAAPPAAAKTVVKPEKPVVKPEQPAVVAGKVAPTDNSTSKTANNDHSPTASTNGAAQAVVGIKAVMEKVQARFEERLQHASVTPPAQPQKAAGKAKAAAEKPKSAPKQPQAAQPAPQSSEAEATTYGSNGRPIRSCRLAPKPASPGNMETAAHGGVSKRAGRKRRITHREDDGDDEADAMETDGEVNGSDRSNRRRVDTSNNGPRAPGTPIPPAPQRAAGVAPRIPLVDDPLHVCPEAANAVCCVCGKDDATDANDLALCDRCDRGFHQLCHSPVVHHFGRLDEQWFCGPCTQVLARERQLTFQEGTFVWARYTTDALPWPARVTSIDFCSLADPRPYLVEYFDSPPNQCNWLPESQIMQWSEGPSFASIRDSKRKSAVRLAEADGAPAISGARQEPVKPLPSRSSVLPVHLRYDPVTVRRNGLVGQIVTNRMEESPVPTRMRRLRVKSPQQAAVLQYEEADEAELSQQAMEMRALIEAARERQSRLEQEVDRMTQSQSQALSSAGA